jgi:hypothetical protein
MLQMLLFLLLLLPLQPTYCIPCSGRESLGKSINNTVMFTLTKQGLPVVLLLAISLPLSGQTQGNTLIEGGKTVVELLKLFKRNKTTEGPAYPTDSCSFKQTGDLCFRNTAVGSILVSLFKRTANGYEATPFNMKVLPRSQECWYTLKAGIYRYRIETGDASKMTVLREGELKLFPCDRMEREIKAE